VRVAVIDETLIMVVSGYFWLLIVIEPECRKLLMALTLGEERFHGALYSEVDPAESWKD